MPFENETTGGETKTPEQIAADQAAQAAAQANAQDHQSVFLVAGERAFKDAESVVKNIENAQSHIATLEAERGTDRERLAAQDAEIARLKKIEEGLDGRDQPGNADATSQLSNEELAAHAAKLAVGLIEQDNTVAVQNANLASAEAKAKEAYGDDYATKVIGIAKELGMNPAAIDALGKQSPSAFAQLFLPKSAGSSHQPSTSTINLPAGQQNGSEHKPVNVTKMRERDRIAHVGSLMKDAGVPGY